MYNKQLLISVFFIMLFCLSSLAQEGEIIPPTPEGEITPPTPLEPAVATASKNQEDEPKNVLKAIINYNFLGGNNPLGSFFPEISYGFNTRTNEALPFLGFTNVRVQFELSPYVSAQIPVADSTTYLPALMLPGNAGIIANPYFKFILGKPSIGKDETNEYQFIIFAPALGLKFLPSFTDSSKTILQHNIRGGVGLKFKDKLYISGQYTWGWHNITSASENTFKGVFGASNSYSRYVNITLQTQLADKGSKLGPLYLVIAWRGFVKNYPFYNLPNERILTFGIVKDISLSRSAPAR